MSPDDIFAANMWPWPDPLLKRDAMGRILFVNAAFLQLYGGRVENWTGQPIQGWPAPQTQGVPYRFETRNPSESGEIIYDWVEVTAADGNAMAIARNVTVFHQPPPLLEPVPQPSHAAQATSHNVQNVAQTQNQQPMHAQFNEQTAGRQATVQPVTQEQAVQNQPAPAAQVSAIAHAPQSAPEIEPQKTPPMPTEAQTAPQALTQEIAAPEQAPAPSTPPVAEAMQEPISQPSDTENEEYSAPERAYERRALPIEDGDAVLGSNWRDAVIARAVGAEAATPETQNEQTHEVTHAAEPEQSSQGTSLKILLAEDNAINALLTRTLLEAEGCVVETVEDGVEAVNAMENNMYDLIFMDMRMPNMDGLEATRKIRAMGARTADLPIIALTANAFDDDRNACFDSGMNDFMTKPVSAEELTQMVENWTTKAKENAA